MSNYAIDTAARFGEIPFVEFTSELIIGVFNSLVEAHVLQMEQYGEFLETLTKNLSTYINETQDNVSYSDIADFVSNYNLQEEDNTVVLEYLKKLQAPDATVEQSESGAPSTATNSWWGSLINAIGPAVNNLVDNLTDNSQEEYLNAIAEYNKKVLEGATNIVTPSYSQIRKSIGALIASNKYSLLQNIARQGALRLVVTEGEIETKITFSTWNDSVSNSDDSYAFNNKVKVKEKYKKAVGLGFLFNKKNKSKTKTSTVTVNTAKSYQRDSSGSKVDIFGRVLIKFKTDYAPLNE